MSRNMKIILAVIAGLVLLACVAVMAMGALGARFFSQAMDPSKAGDVAREIVDYELPDGYRESMGFSLAGVKMAMIAPETLGSGSGGSMPEGLIIMLMQAPPAAGDAAAMREQLLQNMGGQFGMGSANMEAVGTREAVIRGQVVELDLSEGSTRDGTAMRMLSGAFEGKAGPSLLTIVGAPESWDEAVVDAFLGSLR